MAVPFAVAGGMLCSMISFLAGQPDGLAKASTPPFLTAGGSARGRHRRWRRSGDRTHSFRAGGSLHPSPAESIHGPRRPAMPMAARFWRREVRRRLKGSCCYLVLTPFQELHWRRQFPPHRVLETTVTLSLGRSFSPVCGKRHFAHAPNTIRFSPCSTGAMPSPMPSASRRRSHEHICGKDAWLGGVARTAAGRSGAGSDAIPARASERSHSVAQVRVAGGSQPPPNIQCDKTSRWKKAAVTPLIHTSRNTCLHYSKRLRGRFND